MEFGIGVLLGLVAVAVTVTPGISNVWVAAIMWLVTIIYAGFLYGSHKTEIFAFISQHRVGTTIAFIGIVVIVSAGVWVNFVLPAAAKHASAAGGPSGQPVLSEAEREKRRVLYADFMKLVEESWMVALRRQKTLEDKSAALQHTMNLIDPFVPSVRLQWNNTLQDFKVFLQLVSGDKPNRSDELMADRLKEFSMYRANFQNGLFAALFGGDYKPITKAEVKLSIEEVPLPPKESTDPTKGQPYFVVEFAGWIETDRPKEKPMYQTPQFSFRNKGDSTADRVVTRFIVMPQSFIDPPLSAEPSEVHDVLPDALNTYSVAPLDISEQPPLYFVFGVKYAGRVAPRNQLWFLKWDGFTKDGTYAPRFSSASKAQEEQIRKFLQSRNVTLE